MRVSYQGRLSAPQKPEKAFAASLNVIDVWGCLEQNSTLLVIIFVERYGQLMSDMKFKSTT